MKKYFYMYITNIILVIERMFQKSAKLHTKHLVKHRFERINSAQENSIRKLLH